MNEFEPHHSSPNILQFRPRNNSLTPPSRPIEESKPHHPAQPREGTITEEDELERRAREQQVIVTVSVFSAETFGLPIEDFKDQLSDLYDRAKLVTKRYLEELDSIGDEGLDRLFGEDTNR